MKTVILAGGLGTRLSEETSLTPKPMVEIGGRPALWHIMNIYAAHGCTDFIVACGYRGDVIKSYFSNFHVRNNDFFVSLRSGEMTTTGVNGPDWHVGCVDTGLSTMTGGRLLALGAHLESGTFMVTYGDGFADVDITRLLAFHRAHGRLATVTAVRPPPRFGALTLDGERVALFAEKPSSESGWINGGFFVFEPGVISYIEGADTKLEAEPLAKLASDGELIAFLHEGFWKPMDTLSDRNELEALWASGRAPWKIW